MVNTNTTFQTIRQTRRSTGLPEGYLRTRVKLGEIPGVRVGAGPNGKFLVNVPALLEQLERESQGGGITDA